MNKKVEKTLVAALSAAMGAGLVAPVVQAAEASDINALYKAAYTATLTAQTSKTQKDLTEARAALDAFMKVAKTQSEGILNLGRTLSSMLDKVQQPILVNTIKAIETAQKSGKQADINTARALIADMPTVWKNSYSAAISKVQDELANKVKAAVAKAEADKTQEAVDAAKVLVNELLTAATSDVKSYAEAKKAALDAVVVELKVESVSVANARQVKVVFTKATDAKLAGDKANYSVYAEGALSTNLFDGAGSSVVVAEDGKSALLTLETGAAFANYSTANKVVVSKKVGIVADYSVADLKLADATIPTALKVEAVGTRAIKVTFNEPVKDLSGTGIVANLKVDNGALALDEMSATFNDADNSLTFSTYADLTDGAHTVEVVTANDLVDYVGFKVIPTTLTFNYAKDTSAPTVSLVSSNETSIRIRFNKPVDNVNNANVKFSHTYNGSNAVLGNVAVAAVDSQTYDVTFTTPLAPGASTVYLTYVSSTGTKVADKYGNKLAETALTVNTTPDLVAPTVEGATSIKQVNSTTLDVTFTENVDPTTSQDTTKYVLKDSTGTALAISSAVRQADNKVVRLTTEQMNGGSYTLTIKDVKDTAVVQNKMVEKVIGFSIVDAIAPNVRDLKTAGTSYDALLVSAKKVRVGFTEVMKKDSIENKANYLFQGAELPTGTTVTAAADLKSVIIDFTNSDPATTPAASNTISVGRVEDAAGNKIAALATTVTIQTAPAPSFDKIEVISKNQIQVTFNSVITGYTVSDFAIDVDGSGATAYKAPASIVSGTVVEGKTVIVLQTQDDMTIGSWATGAEPHVMTVANSSVLATTQAAATGAQDQFGAKVDFSSTAADDKAVPTLATTTPVYTADLDGNGKIDTLVVKFNENIARTSLSDSTFTVSGHDVISVTTDADGNLSAGVGVADGPYVVITVDEDADNYDTGSTPTVRRVGTVKDTAGNLFTGLVDGAVAADKAAPVVVSWRISTNTATVATLGEATDAITLTYSENVKLGYTAADATKTEWDTEYTLKNGATTGVLASTTVMTASGATTKTITYVVKTADLSTPVTATGATLDTKAGTLVTDMNDNVQAAKTAIAQ